SRRTGTVKDRTGRVVVVQPLLPSVQRPGGRLLRAERLAQGQHLCLGLLLDLAVLRGTYGAEHGGGQHEPRPAAPAPDPEDSYHHDAQASDPDAEPTEAGEALEPFARAAQGAVVS